MIFGILIEMINSRKVNDELNIFSGLKQNKWFIVIWLCELLISVIIIQLSGRVFNVCVQGLLWYQWLISLAFALLLLPLRSIVCKISDKRFCRGVKIE